LASQAQMRSFVNAGLPLDQEDDPRRPLYAVLPWLDTSLGRPVSDDKVEAKGG